MPHKNQKTAAEATAERNKLDDKGKLVFDPLVPKLHLNTDTDKYYLAHKMKTLGIPPNESTARNWADND
jgi:hypothetical protein